MNPTAVAPAIELLDDPLEQQRFTRWTTAGDGRRLAESTLRLSGMTCAACAGIIERALVAVPGVEQASVSAAGERAAVRWDPQKTRPSALLAAIRNAGYDAAPDAGVAARELRRNESRWLLWRLFVAGFCMMQVMMLATPSYVAGPGELAPDLAQLLNWASWVLSLPVLLFSAVPFFAGSWQALRRRRIGMEVPVALGLAVTFVASTGATFAPDGVFGHEVYFDSLTMFVTFLLGARWLDLRARHRAAESLEAALEGMPQQALRLLADGSTEAVSVQRLAPGDRVRVALGDAFPADGRLLEGHTQADEALLSGESTPLAKQPGDELVGGSRNLGAPVTMAVERVGADTRHEAIVAMMRDAMSQRPALAGAADRWAGPFLWTVLALAATSAALWSVIDPSRAVWVAVAVLIVTCPCALSLAVPSTLVAAAGGLARRGVMLQRLDALQAMAEVQHLFIDKTGTLTTQALQLRKTRLLRPSGALPDTHRAQGVAASLAAWSRHPLSLSLARSMPAPAIDWVDVQEQPGAGLQARDAQGRLWRLGARDWVGGVEDEDDAARVFLSADDGGCAAFSFDEVLRDGAAEAMQRLRSEGLRLTLLSGDSAPRAQRMAERLGLHGAVGEATPLRKLAEVAAAQSRGERVAMVGDGVNDAPVLARADVALAMGQGALVARARADAVLVGDRPMDIVRLLEVSRRAMRIVRQNMVWAVAYNAACVPIALAGWMPPWLAGLGMAASSSLVVANAMRVAR